MAEEKQLIVKKNKKHHVDIALAIVTLVLLSLGVIMVLSAVHHQPLEQKVTVIITSKNNCSTQQLE